jgi:nucleoside-triphosphatase
MRIFLTGRPGIGKSAIIKKLIEILKERGLKVAGILTQEIRKGEKRKGFKIMDISSSEEGILSAIGIKSKFKVSKYGVNIQDIDKIVNRCRESIKEADVIVIDEIGKMEFFSENFRKLIDEILKEEKPLIATLHRKYINEFKKFGELIIVTEQNREKLAEELLSKVDKV